MKSFYFALLFASALAQNSTAPDFKGLLADYLSASSQNVTFSAFDPTPTNAGFGGVVSMQTTLAGVRYVSVELELKGNSSFYGSGAQQLVYFQIEEPVPTPTAAARLLQAAANSTNTTAPAAGTGWFEGWVGVTKTVLPGEVPFFKLYNTYGTQSLKGNKAYYATTSFAGADMLETITTSPWQVADSALQTYTAGNSSAPYGTLHTQVWRLADGGNSLLPIKLGQTYGWQAGYRQWWNKNIKAANMFGDTDLMAFLFADQAFTISLCLGALAMSAATALC